VRTHCILVGDLNCSQIYWTNLTAPSDNIQDILLDFTVNNSLEQLINVATRSDHILVLVLSNEPTSIAHTEVICPFSSNDHCQVDFDIFAESSTQPACVNKLDWDIANNDGMCDILLSTDWLRTLSENPMDESFWHAFRNILEQAIDANVPVLPPGGQASSFCRRISYPVDIRRLMARKRCLWRQCKRHPTDAAAKDRYYKSLAEC
jgi:hypothetical protein